MQNQNKSPDRKMNAWILLAVITFKPEPLQILPYLPLRLKFLNDIQKSNKGGRNIEDGCN